MAKKNSAVKKLRFVERIVSCPVCGGWGWNDFQEECCPKCLNKGNVLQRVRVDIRLKEENK